MERPFSNLNCQRGLNHPPSPQMSPAVGVRPDLPLDCSPVIMSGAADMAAKDAIISWYRGEFAAANAIIDALCDHVAQLSAASGGGLSEYESVFEAIHQRRLNWIPVLQMQKYCSIADVAAELRKVAATKTAKREKAVEGEIPVQIENMEVLEEGEAVCDCDGGFNASVDEDSPDSEITDTGSQEAQVSVERVEICENHEDCASRCDQIKMTKGFVAKEPVKGRTVNVAKGLKVYEDMFVDAEMLKLNDFVHELRIAGQNGKLSGETYFSFNNQLNRNKKEQIQLGVPMFGQAKDEAANEQQSKANIEPIPALLQSVINHLVQWRVIPETKKPDGCIINYFDEGEYSQPYTKPPHLDQPICILLLSDSTLAFGRALYNDGKGNFKGHLMLSLKQGSLLLMRNRSADMARHVICQSPSKRASITFYRIHRETSRYQAMTPFQPRCPLPLTSVPFGYEPSMTIVPTWGAIRAPVMMVAAAPTVLSPMKMPPGGTGVFLPWKVRPSKPAKNLPPRAMKARFPDLPSVDTMSDPGAETKTDVLR